MRVFDCVNKLQYWDNRKTFVFFRSELGLLFKEDGSTLTATLQRLIKDGILVRPTRNVYTFAWSKHLQFAPDQIAVKLRSFKIVYESYESALNKLGVIDQIPLGHTTFATSGREGIFHTPYGVIELIHTSRAPAQLLDHVTDRPWPATPIADKWLAIQNMKDAHRDIDLLKENLAKNEEEL